MELIIQPDAHDIVGELNVRGRPSGRAQRRRDGPKYPLLHVPIKQRTIAILARSSLWRIRVEGRMSKEQARLAVLSEFDSWAKKHPDDARMMGGFLFFRYLQTDKSDLLDFRSGDNKWPIVHGWIRDSVEKIS